MVKGLNDVDYTKFFQISAHNKTRGNSLKLEKKQCRNSTKFVFNCFNCFVIILEKCKNKKIT